MLSFRRDHTEALLIERYWAALRRNRATPAPDALDPGLAAVIAEVERDLAPPRLTQTSIEQLWRQIDAGAPEATRRASSGPAIDPAARRRTGVPPTEESQEQHVMSDLSHAEVEPVPIQQQCWAREALKIAAAALVFGIIGAILVLTLRDNDADQPVAVPTTPTATATAAPATTTTTPTEAAVLVVSPTATVPAATATVPAPSPTATPPSLAPIAASIPVGPAPCDIVAGAGSIWVTDCEDGTLTRIDPATNAVVATIEVTAPGVESVAGLAVDDSAVWVGADYGQRIVRVDPATNAVVASIPLDSRCGCIIEFGHGALWVQSWYGNQVLRIDPTSNTVSASIEVETPNGFVITPDAVLVIHTPAGGEIEVARIDPATNTIVETLPLTPQLAGTMPAPDGTLWTATSSELVQIDADSGETLTTIELPDALRFSPFSPLVEIMGDNLWVNQPQWREDEQLWQFDLATQEWGSVMTVPGLGIWIPLDGALWGLTANQTIVRIDLPD